MKKAFIKLLSKTLCKKFYDVFYYGYRYIEEYSYISDTLYSDAFKLVIKQYLNVTLKKDWIGRLYGVMNPNIGPNGMYDFNRTIIEIDGDNTNNNEFIKTWVYKQLQLIANLFKIHNLYDYISMDFEHVGPDNADNYLIVFDITARREFVTHLKSFFKHISVYGIIAAIIMLINIYIY